MASGNKVYLSADSLMINSLGDSYRFSPSPTLTLPNLSLLIITILGENYKRDAPEEAKPPAAAAKKSGGLW